MASRCKAFKPFSPTSPHWCETPSPPALNPAHEFVVHTRPTKLKQKVLDLLAVNPVTCTQ
jgi:hypothetical protein